MHVASITRGIVGVILSLVVISAATAEIIYVDDNAAGANDGTSWTDAYVYLQDALADANDSPKPVEVCVAQGIYKPDQGTAQTPSDRTATFQLLDGVSLTGGFAGVSERDPNARDVTVYKTVLSGDLAGDDIAVDDRRSLTSLRYEPTRGDNVFHVTTATGGADTAILEGFTVCGGYADGPEEGDDNTGAGMYIAESRCVVKDCTFRDNVADYGAGIYLRQSTATVLGCTFSANLAVSSGGGVRNYESNSTFLDCRFTDNLSLESGGGGMANQSGHPVLTGCVFLRNWGHDGGALCNVISDATLTRCEFIENGAYCLVSQVIAPHTRGGAIFNVDSAPCIVDCLVIRNAAGLAGGGIGSDDAGRPALKNCTLIGNRPDGVAGGRPTIRNCIVRDNWDPWNGRGSQVRGEAEVLYCDVEGGLPGEGNIDLAPFFVDAGHWEDPCDTPDLLWDDIWVEGDYHLKSEAGRWDPISESWVLDDVTSPCIDAGDPNSSIAFEPYPNGARVNMGAYGGTAEASKSPSGLHAQYGGGTGEPNDPYLIYTPEHLNALGTEPNDYDKHFKLMADIDLSGYTYDRAVIAPDTNNVQGRFQGTSFMGVLDGNGQAIRNLCIRGGDYLGLVGLLRSEAVVSNLGMVSVNIERTGDYVGGLVGANSGQVTRSYVAGMVSGRDYVGGLVGQNFGQITTSYIAGSVSGERNVGGLAGENGQFNKHKPYIIPGWISNSYCTSSVSGDALVGGLVGKALAYTIATSYSTGRVVGGGGLIGLTQLASAEGYPMTCFWDVETSGQVTSMGGTGLITAEMQRATTFLEAGWDFIDETENGTDDIWWILEGQDYPRLWWELIP